MVRRAHVRGYRIHHGFAGCVLAVVGAVLAWHDRRDLPDWWPARDR
jgi:uncharacterized membrane protein YccC